MEHKKLYEHKVQYYETDQMKIVHHSNYIRWFEEARNQLLDDLGLGYEKIEEMGIIIPVLEVSAKYRTMTRYGDTVSVDTKCVKYNGVTLVLTYVITDKKTGEVRCTGESHHCFLDENGKVLILRKAFPQVHEFFKSLLEEKKD